MSNTSAVLSKPDSICGPVCHSTASSLHAVKLSVGEQTTQLFTKVFDTSDWPPRWYCGTWTDVHGWVYIVSDLLIWACYFAIPILLFRIINKRKDIPFPGIIWLFIAFILLCGTTHFIDATIFWWPAYRLSAIVRLFTGLVSVITVVALHRLLPAVYKLRSVEELEKEIEERKKAEQESRNHQILQRATEELMKKKDEFMSIASHELKTPITSVKGSIQILERMVQKDANLQPVKPFVATATRQVEKLTRIINDLLDVTRIQEGRLNLEKSSFNIKKLIEECIEQCESKDKPYNINVVGDPDAMVYADRTRIDQVICNLLTNALKYSPLSNQVNITIEVMNNLYTKILIVDFGIGIPADKLQYIFNRFYRVENTSQHFPGVGLGLYISSEIIRHHGGDIGVESELDKGSTFYFTLSNANSQ
jgi:chemotaxis family two-component system sensor kinase Cph1